MPPKDPASDLSRIAIPIRLNCPDSSRNRNSWTEASIISTYLPSDSPAKYQVNVYMMIMIDISGRVSLFDPK